MEIFSRLVLILLIGLVGVGSLLSPTPSYAENFPLEWQAPTQNCDGTSLPISDLGSYKIYYSKDSGRASPAAEACGCVGRHQYEKVVTVTDPTVTSVQVPVDEPGTYYVTMTAVDVDGNESCYSQQVVKAVKSITPDAPLNFEISLNQHRFNRRSL